MSENLVFWDLVGHHSNHGELLFHVVVANLCSWPNVKRKVHISYNFIVFLSVTIGNISILTSYAITGLDYWTPSKNWKFSTILTFWCLYIRIRMWDKISMLNPIRLILLVNPLALTLYMLWSVLPTVAMYWVINLSICKVI